MNGRTTRTPKSSCDQIQTHFIFCSQLQRSSDIEHPCSSNVLRTTAEQRTHYNSQLHTRSSIDKFLVWMQVLSTTSGNGSQMTIYRQICFCKTFRSAPPAQRLPAMIFQKKSLQGHFQISWITSDHNLKHFL
ncbi:hypothetical protein TNCV_3436381 [Trichonephila clavipes]|nr:hypothetical protein TNCV_3436381 [Trichonephila clavipes]